MLIQIAARSQARARVASSAVAKVPSHLRVLFLGSRILKGVLEKKKKKGPRSLVVEKD